MFTAIHIFLEMGIDKLLDCIQLLLYSCSNLVPEYDLLKCNERELWVMLDWEEVLIFLNCVLVGRNIEPPFFA